MIHGSVQRAIVTASILLCLGAELYAQKPGIAPDLYKAADIPDSLRKNAHSVVRYYKREIIVKSSSKAIIRSHSIQTILNEKAEDQALMVLGYDKKFSGINNAEMLVYDAGGKMIKRYKKSDMYDRSAVDGISIISDSRMLVAGHTIVSYPVTIEQLSEIELSSFLDLSDWRIQGGEMSVQNAACHITVNPQVGFRYKVRNIQTEPKKSIESGMEVYHWEIHNLPAIVPEENTPLWKVLPHISFATNSIEFDGLAGDMSTWKGFGLWQQNLNKNVSSLSPQREEEIRQMVAGFTTDRGKARFLYEYMQKNMRYVSIQLGIGGLKPFPATFVDEKKYGDCKALSNYMYTLLKAAGIRSHYTLVRAGENEEPADEAFVNDPFNHIILCIPFKNDTTWLECTSMTQPFGQLGTFTENRNVLLITEEGGKLVNTPSSRMEDNIFESDVKITIEPDGIARAKTLIKATGAYRDMYIALSARKTDEQKKIMITHLNLRQPDIFELAYLKDQEGTKEVALDLVYEKLYDMTSAGKYFYRPRILDVWRETFPVVEKRQADLYFSHPLQKKNTTSISLPDDLEVESLPEDVSLTFSYGSFEIKYAYDNEKRAVTSASVFNLNKHIIPASRYNEMQKFMDDLSKATSKKLILKKKA